ncbi:acyl-CoA dehydrogenase family protein [Novosphingobium bradum]|uniref:Acyl-CoA dehydrogenase family protein n=1 Tax=Novosphingobium bradum TaxID=1737444 RepID=A0ABV7IJE0_9SPHN
MNFEFSPEQVQLREEVRRFLAAECPPAKARQAIEAGGTHDPQLWDKLAQMGLIGAAIPEDMGGVGLGYLELCVIAEELGRTVAPVPFAPSVYLGAEMIRELGTAGQQARWLPALATGEAIAAFALAERPGPNRPEAVAATLAGGRLNGTKIAVRGGDCADVAVVAARLDGQVVPCLVDLAQDGVTRTPVTTLDPGLGHATLSFRDVAAEPLATGAAGWAAIRRALDKAAVLMAFEQLGAAERTLDMARDHALDRIAFGRPVGSFQAVKHALADLYTAVVLARSNCWFGAWALSADAPELAEAAAAAWLSACEAARVCAKESLQLHGGMGFTWEADSHLYYRRANLLATALGTMAEWEDQLVDAVVAKQESAGREKAA